MCRLFSRILQEIDSRKESKCFNVEYVLLQILYYSTLTRAVKQFPAICAKDVRNFG